MRKLSSSALLPVATLALGLMLSGCTSGSSGSGGAGAVAAAPQASIEPPLPPGDWRSVYSGRQDMARGWSDRSILISRDADVVDRLVLVYRIHLGKRWEFTPRVACDAPDYFFQEGSDAGAESGACWHVRAVNLGTAGQPHWVNLVLAGHAETEDLFLPAVMVGVRYIRYHGGDLLQVDYLWNADLLLPPPAGRVWTPEDWSNAAVASDPAKQAIMRTLRRWAEDWQPRVAAVMPIADR